MNQNSVLKSVVNVNVTNITFNIWMQYKFKA